MRELSVGRCRDSRRADRRYLRLIRGEGCTVSYDDFNDLLTITLDSLEQFAASGRTSVPRGVRRAEWSVTRLASPPGPLLA